VVVGWWGGGVVGWWGGGQAIAPVVNDVLWICREVNSEISC